jgi:hypothetical protein
MDEGMIYIKCLEFTPIPKQSAFALYVTQLFDVLWSSRLSEHLKYPNNNVSSSMMSGDLGGHLVELCCSVYCEGHV